MARWRLPASGVGCYPCGVFYAGTEPVGGRLLTAEKAARQVEKLPEIITIARAAEVAGVSRRTVREWVRTGKVESARAHQGRGSARITIDTRSLLRLLGW